jgi:hypothetical protein
MRKPALVALSILGGCSDICGNTVVSRVLAPDEQHEAVLFQRDCGATTGFTTRISILDPDRDVSGAGNTFRADADHGAAETGAWGGPWADSKWLSSEHLLVRYAAKSRLFAHGEDVSGCGSPIRWWAASARLRTLRCWQRQGSLAA